MLMMTLTVDVAAAAALPHALTPWGMYLAADAVVKAVMIGLAIASVATWTILIAKGWELSRQAGQLRRARTLLLQSAHLPPLHDDAALQAPAAQRLIEAAHTELRLSPAGVDAGGIKARIGSRLERIELDCARPVT